MRNTTTTVVIAAGAVLAAVIVTRTPAQQEYGATGACCLPGGGCITALPAVCDGFGGTYIGDTTLCDYAGCPGPPQPPTVVGMSVTTQISDFTPDTRYRIFRTWSDGQVDTTWVKFEIGNSCNVTETCGPVVLVTGTCPTDIDRDGDTGINDFLALLGGWGSCR